MAGASAIGEFEKRLKSIIDEVKKSNGRIILFIDEIHMILGQAEMVHLWMQVIF